MARKPRLSRYLLNARIERDIPRSELARLIGVSPQSIWFWESGHCKPKPDNLTALCKALRLPIRHARQLAQA